VPEDLIQLTKDNEFFMREALKEAKKAFALNEIPVGAVLVIQGKIMARSHNQTELLNDSTAHAEILALTSTYAALGAKYATDATLYVTLEPCLMCAGALRWGKVPHIVFGAYDEKNGSSSFVHKNPYHEKAVITGGVLEAECAQLMKDFFKGRR
jgi:tRNA(adenine34) deaminase